MKTALAKIGSLDDFRSRMRRLKNVNLSGTREEILDQLRLNAKKNRTKYSKVYFVMLILLLISVCLVLLDDIGQHYIRSMAGVEYVGAFPYQKASLLMALSLFMAGFIIHSLMYKRITMSIQRVLEINETEMKNEEA
jgi:hypothetical protein